MSLIRDATSLTYESSFVQQNGKAFSDLVLFSPNDHIFSRSFSWLTMNPQLRIMSFFAWKFSSCVFLFDINTLLHTKRSKDHTSSPLSKEKIAEFHNTVCVHRKKNKTIHVTVFFHKRVSTVAYAFSCMRKYFQIAHGFVSQRFRTHTWCIAPTR